MKLIEQPIFSETFQVAIENPRFTSGTFIYRVTTEERTGLSPDYLNSNGTDCLHVNILEESDLHFAFVFNGVRETVNIVDDDSLATFIAKLDDSNNIYVDVTGLLHTTWAVLLKACFTRKVKVKIIYAEPRSYKSSPIESHTYDLSRRISPIKPIPGFAVLTSPGEFNYSFVPLLGFEKRRFELMMTSVDPPRNSIYPIVGVPGFQLQFPFETYIVNKSKLIDNDLYQNVHYAAASCPFRLYYKLQELALSTKSELIKIALVGTKPHALGAVLFHLCSGSVVELLYDHPERKEGRSRGTFKLHIYHVDLFRDFVAN